jgi:hypothetical protein
VRRASADGSLPGGRGRPCRAGIETPGDGNCLIMGGVPSKSYWWGFRCACRRSLGRRRPARWPIPDGAREHGSGSGARGVARFTHSGAPPHGGQTLRKLYAPVWKPWTPVEAVDKKMGAVSEKARNGALEKFPHNPLVPGSSPGGGIPRHLQSAEHLPTSASASSEPGQRIFSPRATADPSALAKQEAPRRFRSWPRERRELWLSRTSPRT